MRLIWHLNPDRLAPDFWHIIMPKRVCTYFLIWFSFNNREFLLCAAPCFTDNYRTDEYHPFSMPTPKAAIDLDFGAFLNFQHQAK